MIYYVQALKVILLKSRWWDDNFWEANILGASAVPMILPNIDNTITMKADVLIFSFEITVLSCFGSHGQIFTKEKDTLKQLFKNIHVRSPIGAELL